MMPDLFNAQHEGNLTEALAATPWRQARPVKVKSLNNTGLFMVDFRTATPTEVEMFAGDAHTV